MNDSNSLEIIDPTTLSSIHGGDAWQNYKKRLKKDFQEGVNHARLARQSNANHGHPNLLKFTDHMIGLGVATGKTAYDVNAGGFTSSVLGLVK